MNDRTRVAKPIGFEATIDLIVRGPVITKSSAIGPWGCDAVFSRDAQGRLFFSGDHIKGKLREAFDRFETEAFYDDMGVRRSRESELIAAGDEQEEHETSVTAQLLAGAKRYPAIFSDFIAEGEWPGPGAKRMTRVKIDAETGAAAPGNLRVVDCPVAPGQTIHFRGDIRYFATSETAARDQLNVILQGLRCIASLGADQTIGSGVVTDVVAIDSTVIDFVEHLESLTALAAEEGAFDLHFRDPLCLPNGVINGNLFESEDEIPGEAIKGAVANCLRQITGVTDLSEDLDSVDGSHPLALLCHHLDKLIIRRARPAKHDQPRPTKFPMSLAYFDETLADTALASTSEPLIFHDSAPAFLHDWKTAQWNEIDRECGYHHPMQELRVRTSKAKGIVVPPWLIVVAH